jgi:LytS/YehU family sensor histidine kinase
MYFRRMNTQLQKILIWAGLAITLFALFHWLFTLALPGAALAFATGITAILMGGLTAGWYASRIWFSGLRFPPTAVFAPLVIILLAAFMGIAFLVNRMIGDTQFFDFAITVLLLFVLSASLSAIISLAKTRIHYQLHAAQTAAAQNKSELQLLQSQLSPHFLFNTLNNIYGHSLYAPDKVPALILKLSDLLRYAIYDTKEMFVPLRDELSYLNNYIEFEKVRLGERLCLRSNLPEIQDSHGIRIAPMLLIVFIENAFKHSKNNTEDKVFIDIRMELGASFIDFKVKNATAGQAIPGPGNKHSGFGLATVRKRLHLLYPNTHSLTIRETGQEFEVFLKLITNET